MNTITCPLCGLSDPRPVWRRQSYPATGGKAIPIEKAQAVPWLPMEISLCLNCDHIYQSRPPAPEVLESFYSGFYATTDPSTALGGTPSKSLAVFLEQIRQAVGDRRGRALEIGAYDGYFLHLLEEDGWSATGYEPADIGELGKEIFKVDIRREFYQPGCSGESWDLVVSRYVFEHLSSPREMIASIFQDLAPGGWLALEVPDLQTRLKEGTLGSFVHEHISYFVPATFRRLVEESGFEVKEMAHSADGLALIAQKPTTRASAHKAHLASQQHQPAQELIAQFKRRQTEQRQRFTRELSRWSGSESFIVYGGDSHTTELLVDGWLPPEKVSCIIDDDPAKQGCVAAGFSIPIVSCDQLPQPGQALVVLSAFRHHDQLWNNLSDWRSRGGAVVRFYPQCRLADPKL